jgi:hypothetical protein
MAMPLAPLIAISLLLFSSAPPAALPGFRVLPPRSVEQHTYQQSRELALRLVRLAMPRLDPGDASMAYRVLIALQRAHFEASSDTRSSNTCRARNFSLFVNAHFRDTIFVCDEVRTHAQGGGQDALDRIAQGFVHEAVHLTGEMDECVATRFELAVMERSIGVRSAGSQLRYGRECRGRL